MGCTDRKTRNPRPSPPPPPDAVWFALYLCGCTSLSIAHESIPYSEWEELKPCLHLRHCDVSEAFMQMFKREHPIGPQSMILALLTVTSCEGPDAQRVVKTSLTSWPGVCLRHPNIHKWQVDTQRAPFSPVRPTCYRNHKRIM